MKLPVFRHQLDLLNYFRNQYIDSKVLSRWLLLKSITFNKLIIKPYLRSFTEVPKLIINDDLTTSINGLWILHEGGSSKVILGDGSLLRFDARTYFTYSDILINVYNNGVSLYDLRSNREEWILKSPKDIIVEGFYGSSLLLSGNKRKYLISPLIRSSPFETDYVKYYESKTTSLLVFKRGRNVFALLSHKYLNVSKLYELSKCREVNEVLVGDCLGLINCVDGSYLISFNNLLRIPFNAFPLVDAGNRYLLHDQQHNLLIEFNGREVKPLMFTISPKVVGSFPDGELIIISNKRPYMLNNNIWRLISNRRVIDGSVGISYMIFHTPNSLELFSFNSHIASYKLMNCSIINDALVCVYEGKALIYDLTELRDLYVGIESNSSIGYPRLVIAPWSKISQLSIKGPIVLLSNSTDNNSIVKEFSIKPIKLGVEVSFKAIIDFILTRYVNSFKVMSNKPEILDLRISEVKYSINGRLGNGDDNLFIRYFLSIYNPLPEELKITVNYVNGDQIIKSYSYILKPGCSELELENSLRVFSSTLQLLIEYEWINRSEVLAVYTLDLTKYLVSDPYSTISYSLEYIDGCRYMLRLTNPVNQGIPVNVSIMCADGRRFNGINGVVIEECRLPAILEFSYSFDVFHWVKHQLISSNNLVFIDVKSSDKLDVKVNSTHKCVNGFIDSEISLKVSEVNPLKKLLLTPLITSREVKIKLIYEFSDNGTLIALVGSTVYVSKGFTGEVTLELNSLLINDIIIVVLSGGIRDVYVISCKEMLKKYLELACGVALHLKNLAINW